MRGFSFPMATKAPCGQARLFFFMSLFICPLMRALFTPLGPWFFTYLYMQWPLCREADTEAQRGVDIFSK